MSDGLLVPLNDEEFAAEAPEVHVIDHVGSLARDLVHRLTKDRKGICHQTRHVCLCRQGHSRSTHQDDQLVLFGVVCDAERSDGLFILFMSRLTGAPADVQGGQDESGGTGRVGGTGQVRGDRRSQG